MTTSVQFRLGPDTEIAYEMSFVPRIGETIHFTFGPRGEASYVTATVTKVVWTIVDDLPGDQSEIVDITVEVHDHHALFDAKRKYLKNKKWLSKRVERHGIM
jgi:hypothetical protein